MIWFRMKPPTILIVLTALCTALIILGKCNSHLIHKLIIYRSYYDYVVANEPLQHTSRIGLIHATCFLSILDILDSNTTLCINHIVSLDRGPHT